MRDFCLDGIYQMKYIEQHEHFTDFLIWLKAGMHSREDYLKLPNNETCNAYLKEVFRFYTFMDQENNHSGSLKVLSDTQMIVRNSIGIRKVLNRKSYSACLACTCVDGKRIHPDGKELQKGRYEPGSGVRICGISKRTSGTL